MNQRSYQECYVGPSLLMRLGPPIQNWFLLHCSIIQCSPLDKTWWMGVVPGGDYYHIKDCCSTPIAHIKATKCRPVLKASRPTCLKYGGQNTCYLSQTAQCHVIALSVHRCLWGGGLCSSVFCCIVTISDSLISFTQHDPVPWLWSEW